MNLINNTNLTDSTKTAIFYSRCYMSGATLKDETLN
jgi:hypothetical protein